MWKTSVFAFMKISPTFDGARQRVRTPCFIDSVRSVCMQMTLSDNLQSQLLIFKPPDRMSAFISDNFNTFCFTVYMILHCTTVKKLNCLFILLIFLHFTFRVCKMTTFLKVQSKPDRRGFLYLLLEILTHCITGSQVNLIN